MTLMERLISWFYRVCLKKTYYPKGLREEMGWHDKWR